MSADSPWLNIKQAAAYVHRGRDFIGREIRAGRLRAARIGGRGEILTRAEWLDAWVQDQAKPILIQRRTG
jgi:excisionase family DNA binding protein